MLHVCAALIHLPICMYTAYNHMYKSSFCQATPYIYADALEVFDHREKVAITVTSGTPKSCSAPVPGLSTLLPMIVRTVKRR